jgi:hypothetical protein
MCAAGLEEVFLDSEAAGTCPPIILSPHPMFSFAPLSPLEKIINSVKNE